jgi:ATP-binding cassette subfamily F protein 3
LPLLTVQNLDKSFGDRVIFDSADLLLDRGERVGLIGDNGSGKTTLFRILTGEIEPESGVVALNKGLRVGHLTQDATFDPANAVIDEAELAFAHLHEMSHALRDLEHRMAEQSGDALADVMKRYERLEHQFDLDGGYAWRHKLEATLLGVGLSRDLWEINVEKLSGGQRSRLNLAKLLIAEPDVLLLDEPTNHLDLAAIEWLEDYLLAFPGAVLLISHDRYLLDRLATRIVWLTRAKLRSYPGNYSAFAQQRRVQELSQSRAYEEQQAYIARQEEYIRRYGAGQRAREAQGRQKRLRRLLRSDQMIEAVESRRSVAFSIDTDQRAGDQVLHVHGLCKRFDNREIWNDVGFRVGRGDRVGIIGPNGSGKTTLLRVLLGEEPASAGRVKWGVNLSIGYYDQRLDDFDPDAPIIDEIRRDRPPMPEQGLRDMLAVMLFRGDDIYKPMGLLSGGERARVAFVELLLDEPNVLLMDEPTNHLDIASADALQQAIAGFPGTILCVSHDRYFLDRVTSRLLVLDPPAIREFDGQVSAWLSRQRAHRESDRARKDRAGSRVPRPAESTEPAPASKTVKDNPYKRRFGRLTMDELEAQIHQTEQALRDCQREFGDTAVLRDADRAREVHARYESLQATLAELEAEYFSRG